mgnify:CR=1 FL=1
MKNMGRVDRTVRSLVAVAIVVALLTGIINGTLAIILGVVALAFILTSLFGMCPLYALFGISTRQSRHRRNVL